MSLFNQIGDLLQQYANGTVPATTEEAHAHYDQIAANVPPDQLASAMGPAMAALGGSALREKVAASAAEMTGGQRGSLMQTLLAALGPNMQRMLPQLGIRPEVTGAPEQANPQEVAALAQHVQQTHPDVFNRAMGIYAQHPLLVKALGTVAIAKIAQQLTRRT